MAWDAIFIIGGFCALLGVLLYVPARWWAKRKLRTTPPESAVGLHVTSAGLAFSVLVVSLLVAGLLQPYVAPQSEFAQFLSTGIGIVAFFGAMAVLGGVLAMLLEMLGFALYRRPNNDGR